MKLSLTDAIFIAMSMSFIAGLMAALNNTTRHERTGMERISVIPCAEAITLDGLPALKKEDRWIPSANPQIYRPVMYHLQNVNDRYYYDPAKRRWISDPIKVCPF